MSPSAVLGSVLGVVSACGVVLVVLSILRPRPRSTARDRGLSRLIHDAGDSRLSVSGLLAACGLCGLGAGVLALAITAVPVAGLLATVTAATAPILVLRRRAAARRRAVRAAWPDAVDTLVSAVRAGLALPDALGDLGRSGPEPLQAAFAAFDVEYRATGSLAGALDVLQTRLADPVADRVVAAVRLTREFGGPDLGTVLRTLSTMLREDSRTRGEIEARQSWTVAAARMAVAAPWLTLAFLSTRPETARAYATVPGAGVLVVAALMSALAYAAMMRIGRLPADERAAA